MANDIDAEFTAFLADLPHVTKLGDLPEERLVTTRASIEAAVRRLRISMSRSTPEGLPMRDIMALALLTGPTQIMADALKSGCIPGGMARACTNVGAAQILINEIDCELMRRRHANN